MNWTINQPIKLEEVDFHIFDFEKYFTDITGNIGVQ